eukprot:93182-Hanusia_phi.AAC.1
MAALGRPAGRGQAPGCTRKWPPSLSGADSAPTGRGPQGRRAVQCSVSMLCVPTLLISCSAR